MQTTPTNIICENYKTKKEKIRKKNIHKEFILLKPGEEDNLLKLKYTVPHLKHICKQYKQSTSGNKQVLLTRVYEYLRKYIPAQRIQTTYKRYLLYKYLLAKGPAFIKRTRCINETDFFTMEAVADIAVEQFVSFKDDDGMIYGFDILSLYNIWLKCSKPYRNPYNRNIFPLELEKNCEIIHKFSASYFNPVNVKNEPEKETVNYELSVLNIFQEINALGNYADHMWFLSLARTNLIKFIRELVDIWSYRADLTVHMKIAICPPNGNPFTGLPLNILTSLETERLKQTCLSIIQSFVLAATVEPNRSLGASFVLCALTLVSEPAATALPWLYQSVANY